MRKFAILIAVASLALPGCATLMAARTTICDNYHIVRDQTERQIENANEILDPTKRAAVLAIGALTLAALKKCPAAAKR